MTSMNTAISQAIRVQAAREGISLRKISKEIGMGYTSFWSRLGGERSWNTDQLTLLGGERSWNTDQLTLLAKALHLDSAWTLISIAEEERAKIDDQTLVA